MSGTVFSLADLEQAAEGTLPPDVWDFIAGGSGRELTLAANRAALDRIHLVPRVLRDVSECGTDTELLGQPAAMPVAVAPIAYHQLVHPAGEVATARAAKAAGVPFTVGTLSSVPLPEIAEVGGCLWFQLYWPRQPGEALRLARAAQDAGCRAIMLTADVPWMGRRLRDLRNQFTLPGAVSAAILESGAGSAAHRSLAGGSAVAEHTRHILSPSLTWAHVAQLREATELPLILKGVLAAEDAATAVECGVDAIVVSNHGGRQLDGAAPSAAVLAEVCQAVAGRCAVLLDSGVRSGADVLKALALGAAGVLIGRPVMWGLAVGGEAGARQVLDLLASELRDALGLAGCDSVAAAGRLRALGATG